MTNRPARHPLRAKSRPHFPRSGSALSFARFPVLFRAALAVPLLLAGLGSSADPASADTGTKGIIMTDSGPVIRVGDGVYKGIPYAAPPVGSLRWRPPAPVPAWSEPRAFDRPGPQCPQEDADAETSEDCLSLNIRVPNRRDGSALPVMVFIHGGAFYSGSGSLDLYEGEALADLGVVLVTLNYRLGPLGFLAHPLLSAESERGVSGNYGLMDQQAALAWVRRNIAAFGGDPRNVTAFGQSAGAASILAHMVSPDGAGLFDKAILQSPVAAGAFRPLKTSVRGVSPAEEIGRRVARRLGADVAPDPLAAMRAAPVKAVFEAARLGPGEGVEVADLVCCPTVDGALVPDHPLALFRQGRQSRIPLLVGNTANEATLFLKALDPPADTPTAYTALVKRRFGPDAANVLALVPGREPDLWSDLDRMVSARWFLATSRFVAREQARAGAPCFVYRHALPPPFGALLILAGEGGSLGIGQEEAGTPHSADLFPVFGYESSWLGFDAADRAMGQAMRRAWTNFAMTGDPGKPAGPGGQGVRSVAGPAWPRFAPSAPMIMEFGRTATAKPLPDEPLIPMVERSWRTTTY